jgi:DNA polymerase III epsilon subunit-like protein
MAGNGIAFALDLETTSTVVAETTPVQLCLLSEDKQGRRTLMNTLVRPHEWISEEVTKIHGITDDMVRNSPDYGMVAWTAYLLHNAFQPEYLVTFNGETFDEPILARCLGAPVFPGARHIDVLSVAYRYLPGLPSYRLGALYQELLGWPLENAHDASADVNATLDLLKAMRVRIGMTMDQLASEMETPKPYAIYPIGKKYAGWLIEDIPQSYGQWALSAFTSIRPDLLVTLKAIAGAS